ncbi:MAG: hypothetical protein DRP11_03880 [Candidatus Aenigmatarchaeota archaeon]|nr:MAG: hypothetical protein DRP11_03880 [Candidatus Aenigmarchaeota archaeon]
MVNYLIIVLDSCRYDLFVEVLPETEFFRKLGKVTKSYSVCSVTGPSFVEIFGNGYFPQPVPDNFPFKPRGEVNFIQHRAEYKVLFTGMPMLWKGSVAVRSTVECFDDYRFQRTRSVCKEGVDYWNELSRAQYPLFFVLWTGETHWPYSLQGYDGTLYGSPDAYNRGRDVYKPEFFELLKRKQKEMIAYCDEQLSKLKFYLPTWVIVMADHGEAMGEDHKIGHGVYPHAVEFEVPFQCKLVRP